MLLLQEEYYQSTSDIEKDFLFHIEGGELSMENSLSEFVRKVEMLKEENASGYYRFMKYLHKRIDIWLERVGREANVYDARKLKISQK